MAAANPPQDAESQNLATVLAAFGIKEDDLRAYKHHTDNVSLWGMELIPTYATTNPVMFKDFWLQQAISAAADYVKVPRPLFRYVMSRLPPASKDGPHDEEPPIDATVCAICEILKKEVPSEP
jgi:hypothetical protein